jgi:hypothetical protein
MAELVTVRKADNKEVSLILSSLIQEEYHHV